jgi:hypothetical protein
MIAKNEEGDLNSAFFIVLFKLQSVQRKTISFIKKLEEAYQTNNILKTEKMKISLEEFRVFLERKKWF